MSDQNKVVVQNYFPIMGLLGIVFVTLKLLGYITWSWWWVTAPFWAPLALWVAGFLIGVLFIFGGLIIQAILAGRRK